ncbi:hypothetical protein F511_42326 [Dorcoceras hygrometricum]|uniref:Uncharacterized protein n=1 Tax=Dorcoceras hygrometricum TaxID=472368 RepID=A0A2Z7CER1_9LAMI|nr:hypothetical protein F511_42326 [Dorcoceras hygrometricum]
MKSRVQTQNVEVQYGSSPDQVQSTSAVFKLRFIDKSSDQVQIYQPAGWKSAGNGAKLEPRSSSRAGKNRKSSAVDKKRRRCRSFSRTSLKMKSNQLDEESS